MLRWPSHRLRRAPLLLFAGLLLGPAGCDDRERITAPSGGGGGGGGGSGEGPVTTIRKPGAADTTVTAGPGIFVVGQVTAESGIDSVYFDITGGVTQIPPIDENGVRTMTFAIPLTTLGQAGQVIVVDVYGVDLLGTRGDAVRRRITVE